MGLAFRIMIFTVMINIAVGIMLFIGGASWQPEGLTYTPNVEQNLNQELNTTTIPPLDPTQNFLFRILDIVTLGVSTKIQVFLGNTIFALPNMLVSVGLIPQGMNIFLHSILVMVYIVGTIELFTGKDITTR